MISLLEANEVTSEQVVLAQLAGALNDDVEREFLRRKRIKEFRSNLLPGDKFEVLNDEAAPYLVFFGGRDARKSWSIAERLVRRMNKEHEFRVLCTRQYQNSIKDSVHRVLADTVWRLGLEDRFRITKTELSCPATNGEFLFKGLQKPAELKSTERCKVAWVAEAQDVTEDSWENLEPTIRMEDSQIIVDFNTTSIDTPTWQRFVVNPPPGAVVRKVGWEDNPYLSNRSRAKIEHMRRTDPDAFEYVYGGNPRQFSEAKVFGGKYVIEGFDETIWLRAKQSGARRFFGLDFGFAQDPTALISFFVLDNILYIEHEAFGWQTDFAGEMKPGLRPEDPPRGELEQLMDSVPESRGWPIKADAARPETISFLVQKGFNVSPAAKWEGCVEDGVTHIRGFEKIVIHTRCREMQQEAMLYSHKVDRITRQVLPAIVDSNNHGWDAVRYGLDGYIQHRDNFDLWGRLGEGS